MAWRLAASVTTIIVVHVACTVPRAEAPALRIVGRREGGAFAWAPDGRGLAYAQGDTLAIADTTGGFSERCRVRPSIAKAPIREILWSPNGARVAFISPRSGDPIVDGWDTIWLTTADCGTPRDLLPPAPPFGSPGVRSVSLTGWLDVNRVAFAMHVGPGAQRVDAVYATTGRYESFCVVDGGVYWSADRRRGIANLQSGAVGFIDPADAKPVTDGLADCAAALPGCMYPQSESSGIAREFEAWSPDGRLVMLRTGSCPPLSQLVPSNTLVVWDLATGRQARLASHAIRAAWSPDGRQIAIVLFGTPLKNAAGALLGGSADDRAALSMTLVVVDAASRRSRLDVPLGVVPPSAPGGPVLVPDRDPADFRPAWSHDGRHLLARDGRRRVVLVPVTGGEPTRLSDGHAAWSPAGAQIATSDDRMMTILRLQ
jgi:WD40-like Beta Propeller Repeat